MTHTDKLNIIVVSASGFTGKLVCEYLSKTYGTAENIHWGIAGR